MFEWHLNIYSVSLFISAIVSIITANYVWRRRQSPGTLPVVIFMAAAVIWSAGYALELGSTTIAAKVFWAKIQYLGIVTAPAMLLISVIQYVGRQSWLTKRNLVLLSIEPIITLLLFWTNEIHGLVWQTWELIPGEPCSILGINYGWFFWVHISYSYLALLTGMILLIRAFRRSPEEHRGQVGILLASTLIPWVGNGLYVFNLNPFPNLDLTPFAFALTGVFLTLGLFRFQLFMLPTISRETFTAPHPTLLAEEDRRRARFLATILLVLFPLLFFPELIRSISNPRNLIYFGPASAVVIIAYVFSRTRYYKAGVWLSLLTFTLLPIAGIVTQSDFDPARTLNMLIWMVPTLILGSLLLSPVGLLVLFVGATGIILSLPLLVPAITFPNLITPISLNLAATVLLMAIARIRMQDIDKLETGAKNLSDSNKFLNEVIDSLSSPFYVINANDYSIELANKSASALGIDENKTCYALTHRSATPCSGIEHPCPLAQVKKTKEHFVVEHIHYKPDGKPYYVEMHGYPILDSQGKVIQMIEYSLDITDRKKAEEEIRKLSQAIEQSASTVVITDTNGDIEYANPAFTQITGYTFAEAQGENPRILKSGKMTPEFYSEMWATLLNGDVWAGEMINKKKNGEFYWENATISPVKNDEGTITHYVAVKDDISDRKKMEAELVIARDRALDANRLKSQILANVSHDMRTPLGAILGYAEMLRNNLFGPVSEAQHTKLDQIVQSSHQLSDFINNILGQSEIASGRLILKKEKIYPKELILGIETVTTLSTDQKGLELNTEISTDAPDILLSDHYWLRRILSNLVRNAVKFTESGGITVRIFMADQHHWALQVADTGIGISKTAQAYIFEPFRKGDEATTGNTRTGSGLGLSIVKDIVSEMGGEIKLDSEIGKGSTFTVLLPLQLPEEKP